MVGGGAGAGIAKVHRAAMRLEGGYQLVADAFSRDPVVSRQAGDTLDIAAAIHANLRGDAYHPQAIGFPTIEDGMYGMKFIEAMTASHETNGKWISAVAFD